MSECTGSKRLDNLSCIGSVVRSDTASKRRRRVKKEGQISAFSCKKSRFSLGHDKGDGSRRTNVGVGENNQGVRVIEPFYSVAALVVIPFFEHELEVAGLESACKVSVCPREWGNAYSAEKFARWRILVTAAESWRWEEEEAARRVPLGREMDMADVDFLGGGGRPCGVQCREGRKRLHQQQQHTT